MKIRQNISLKPFNTFGIDVKAQYFVEINAEDDYQELLSSTLVKENRFLLMGSGSNILFTDDFEGLVAKINTKGIEILDESTDFAMVKAQAGENWDEFVKFCISKKFEGIENLSMIPGNVGSCPVQNIGAYGVEVKDTIHEVEAIEIATGKRVVFTNAECKFGYRDSVFKNEFKNKYIIVSVTFNLSKKSFYTLSYGSIAKELRAMCLSPITLKGIGEAISNIRSQKLPDPKELGNGGSFFKNPVVSAIKYAGLKANFPEIKAFEMPGNSYKLAAGWMIEQLPIENKRNGNVGIYAKQSLIIVNFGNASGKEVLEFATNLRNAVKRKFDIQLDFEINII